MCRFMSALLECETGEVKVWDLCRHTTTREHHRIHDSPYRDYWIDMYYLPDGTIQIPKGQTYDASSLRSSVLARWPTWGEFLQWSIAQGIAPIASLNLFCTPVSDVSPLAGLTELTWLYLSHAQVSDLSPLAGLTGLRTLDLYNTKVSDLSPLAGLKHCRVIR